MRLLDDIAIVRHVAESLVFLGLVGTVVGFIIALSGVDPSRVASIDSVAPMVATHTIIGCRLSCEMQLELPADSDTLWKRFSSKLRAQIRRPQKAGAQCREGGVELLGDFYAVFSRNMRDLGTPVFPESMFAQILKLFPASTRVFVVYLDEAPAAAGITIGYRGLLEIPVASSLRQYNRQAVNMLLYWTVLEYAIREQYRVFDFGRSTVDSGPHRFKKQWGAEPQPLLWHYWLQDEGELPQLNPSNPRFRLATAVWRKLPVPLASYLGPKVIRYLA